MKSTKLISKKLSMSVLIFLLTINGIMGASIICKAFLPEKNDAINQQRIIHIEHWVEYTALKNRLEQSLDFYKGLVELSNLENKETLKEKVPELYIRGKNIFEDIQVIATNQLVPTLPSEKKEKIVRLLEEISTLQNEVISLKPTSKQSIFNYNLCVYHLNYYIDSLLVDTEKLISS